VLNNSVGWQVLASCALLLAFITMVVHIVLTRDAQDDSEAAPGSAAGSVQLSAPEIALREERDKAKLWFSLCAMVLVCVSVPPLVKASRGRGVDEIASADAEVPRRSHNLGCAWATFIVALCFGMHAMLWGSGAQSSSPVH
jgi:hypothetical protein